MAAIEPVLFVSLIIYTALGALGILIGAVRDQGFGTVLLWYIGMMFLGAILFPYLLGVVEVVLFVWIGVG